MLEKIKLLLSEEETTSVFKRNLIKEYLQIPILSFLYSNKKYQDLVFYGGSCLKHCFELPRLSEDLDFVNIKKEKIDLNALAKDIQEEFSKKFNIQISTRIQKFRIYLKFPILHKLDLTKKNETDLLIIKIEIFEDSDFLKNYQIELIPIFKFNESVLIKTFDISTLMATKLNAILNRKWEKTDKKTKKITIRVKGRDYFDFMWYLDKKIKPNMKCIPNIKSIEELKKNLLLKIKNIDNQSIELDLKSLVENQKFVKNLSKNLKQILKKQLNTL